MVLLLLVVLIVVVVVVTLIVIVVVGVDVVVVVVVIVKAVEVEVGAGVEALSWCEQTSHKRNKASPLVYYRSIRARIPGSPVHYLEKYGMQNFLTPLTCEKNPPVYTQS